MNLVLQRTCIGINGDAPFKQLNNCATLAPHLTVSNSAAPNKSIYFITAEKSYVTGIVEQLHHLVLNAQLVSATNVLLNGGHTLYIAVNQIPVHPAAIFPIPMHMHACVLNGKRGIRGC